MKTGSEEYPPKLPRASVLPSRFMVSPQESDNQTLLHAILLYRRDHDGRGGSAGWRRGGVSQRAKSSLRGSLSWNAGQQHAWESEIRMVEEIEELSLKSQLHMLRQGKPFRNVQIAPQEARAAQSVFALGKVKGRPWADPRCPHFCEFHLLFYCRRVNLRSPLRISLSPFRRSHL